MTKLFYYCEQVLIFHQFLRNDGSIGMNDTHHVNAIEIGLHIQTMALGCRNRLCHQTFSFDGGDLNLGKFDFITLE